MYLFIYNFFSHQYWHSQREHLLEVFTPNEKIVKYIDGVIKSIDNRGWDIRNAQDWKKFEAGMM